MFGSLTPLKERTPIQSHRLSRMMRGFEDEMEDLVDRFFGRDGDSLPACQGFVPKMDLVETESALEVHVDLPGLTPKDVEVEVKDGDLWISGSYKEDKEEKGKTLHRLERHRGEFRRVLALPSAINEEGIEAKFVNGVLHITVPKTADAQVKHVPING